MFEKLFVKTSDLVFHKITPYAVERESFPAHHVKRAHTPQILELLECAVLLGGSIQADIALAGVLSPGVAGEETVECVERRATGFERATFRSRNVAFCGSQAALHSRYGRANVTPYVTKSPLTGIQLVGRRKFPNEIGSSGWIRTPSA